MLDGRDTGAAGRGAGGVLADCLRWTERETLAAGEALSAILSDSQVQLNSLDRLAEELRPSDRESLGGLTDRLLRFVEAVGAEMTTQGASVAEISDRASSVLEKASQILGLVRRIQRISACTRLLALNARIETGRTRSDSHSLAALASEMKALSDEVTEAAVSIEALGAILTETLPSIASAGEAVATRCREASSDLERELWSLRGGFAGARAGVESIVAESRDRGARIREQYFEVLSHLQFQDLLEQKLAPVEAEHLRRGEALTSIRALLDELPSHLTLEQIRPSLLAALQGVEAEVPSPRTLLEAPRHRPEDPDSSVGEIQFL